MTLNQFLVLLATVFGAIGSIYVLKSILRLSPEITYLYVSTRLDFNPEQIESLSEQKADSIIGTGLIIVALLIAIVNAAVKPSDVSLFSDRLTGVIFSSIFAFFVYIPLCFIGRKAKESHISKTYRIIMKELLIRIFNNREISEEEINYLKSMNQKYIKIKFPTGISKKEFLMELANKIGVSIPNELQII